MTNINEQANLGYLTNHKVQQKVATILFQLFA